MPAQPTHGVRKLRSRWTWIAAGVAALLVVVLAVVLVVRSRDQAEQRDLAAQWRSDVTAWSGDVVTSLPDPAVRLAPLATGAANETADQVAALRAECDRAATTASDVAALAGPPAPPADLRESTPGYDELAAEVTSDAAALTTYQGAVADAAAAQATWCAGHPDLAQVTLDQQAGLATYQALLGACSVADTGCLPADTAQWAAVADAIGPAYAEPARSRATLYGSVCPVPTLADVCALLAQQNTELGDLYDAYAQALRGGVPADVDAARSAIQAARTAQDAALGEALTTAVPGATGAPTAVLAAAVAQAAIDADLARAQAEDPLLVAIG
ncbi:hypothetical protein [Miniimonas sp. S16]|uniref:hypothetical protein n=1 Tax=Miniimonas sp. S16 TaxID=2171623 RepID=UPI000D527FA3|nr:hypothetical protein [Miniimonas sp. S16]